MIGSKVNMLMPSPHRELHDTYLENYLRTGQAKIIGIGREVTGRRKDGSLFPMDLAINEIRLDGGRIFMGLVHDLTEHKRTEEALRRARDELEIRVQERTVELRAANEKLKRERYLFDTLMDHLPHSIYFKDTASRFTRINRWLARRFGLDDADEAIGKTDADFFTSEHAVQAMADEQEILRTGQPIADKEEKETWPDGHTTWVATTKMPLYDEEGHIMGTFGISRNITLRKQAEEALRAAKEVAEAASRAKSTFLANMSHEIRTPMNAIIGMTELVLDTQLSPQQREFLSVVAESAESLLAVINDILDFSKIEAGKLLVDCAPFDVREHLGDTMKTLALRADRKGIELACHIHPQVPEVVMGDGPRLRQVLINLVGNAIKFTDQGEVVVEVEHEMRIGRGSLAALQGFRHRDRHPGRKTGGHLRGLRTGRRHRLPPLRRHGSGPGNLFAARQLAGRADMGRKRGGPRQHLPLRRALLAKRRGTVRRVAGQLPGPPRRQSSGGRR